MAPYHWFVQPSVASYISFGVGYCLYQRLRQCKKPHGCGKDNKFPHLLFLPATLGKLNSIFIEIMKREKNLNLYEAPQMSVVELIHEQTILQASIDLDDPTVTNPDMGWGD